MDHCSVMFRCCRRSSCRVEDLAMFKHMFINANVMILLKIFQKHADLDLGVPDLRVQH